jgi:hypothetical protein
MSRLRDSFFYRLAARLQVSQPAHPARSDHPEKVVSMRTVHNLLTRLRAEYLEMPGLRLTPEQVQRLCGIEPMMCQSVLDSLLDAKFLRVTPDGRYARLTDGETISRPRAAKADLVTDTRAKKAS